MIEGVINLITATSRHMVARVSGLEHARISKVRGCSRTQHPRPLQIGAASLVRHLAAGSIEEAEASAFWVVHARDREVDLMSGGTHKLIRWASVTGLLFRRCRGSIP